MDGKSNRTSRISAGILIGFNFIIMLFCIIMFAFSLWIIASADTLYNIIERVASPTIKTLLSPNTLTVQFGVAIAAFACFVFFISVMGLYGAINRSQFLLFMYSTLVLLLLLLECALFYYFSSNLVEKGLQEQDGQWTHALRIIFHCCENNTATSSSSEVNKLPWSCCGPELYPDNCTALISYQKNCHNAIPTWLERYRTAIYTSLAVLHIVLLSCSLIRRSRSSFRTYS